MVYSRHPPVTLDKARKAPYMGMCGVPTGSLTRSGTVLTGSGTVPRGLGTDFSGFLAKTVIFGTLAQNPSSVPNRMTEMC